MQKFLVVICFLAVLAGSFFGSIWYQQVRGQKTDNNPESRKILHYVDPMNPAHTSDQPGIAPCGMPMEPVYSENEAAGGDTSLHQMRPGTVKISTEKQQIIGVRVEKVETSPRVQTLRTLGRVAADEDLTYRVIASTDGWVRDVQRSTTGSIVSKDRVMATISSYSSEFYSWQQQYLTYTGSPRLPVAQTSRTRQSDMNQGTEYPSPRLRRPPQPEAIQSAPQQVDAQADMPPQGPQQSGEMQPEPHQHGSQRPATHQAEAQIEAHQHEALQPESMQTDPQPPADQYSRTGVPKPQIPGAMPTDMQQGQTMQRQSQDFSPKQPLTRLNLADYNSYRAKLELLNLGFTEEQLDKLVQTGQYGTEVDIKAPVTGFVLTRNVSPRQKVDKGAELFRIADLSRVWVLADIFEGEASFVRPGTMANVTIPQQSGSFKAKVTDALPQYDTITRTRKVRLEVDNPKFTLVPDMVVDVEFQMSLSPATTLPVDAVLDSGLRKTVFVDKGNGFFEPRNVTTGWRNGGRVEIVDGIIPGESVVVSGNFLVDSESRMRLAALRLMEDKAESPGNGQQATIVSTPLAVPPTPPTSQPVQKTIDPVEKSKDPVCGMTVKHDKAITDDLTFELDGTTYYFCSVECKEQFKQEPKRFLVKMERERSPGPSSVHGGHSHD